MDAFRRLLVIAVLVAALLAGTATAVRTAPLVVDHASTDLAAVPASAVANATTTLHIAYGHISHGSQLVGGMTNLTLFAGAPLPPSTYAFNEGGTGGTLDLDDYFADGDLGNPDLSSWAGPDAHVSEPAREPRRERRHVVVVRPGLVGVRGGDRHLSLAHGRARARLSLGHVRVHDRPPRRIGGIGEPEPAKRPDP